VHFDICLKVCNLSSGGETSREVANCPGIETSKLQSQSHRMLRPTVG